MSYTKRQLKVIEALCDDLDTYFPNADPCAFCNDTVLGQRHRIIDSVAERFRAGVDDAESIRDEFDVDLVALCLALAVTSP